MIPRQNNLNAFGSLRNSWMRVLLLGVFLTAGMSYVPAPPAFAAKYDIKVMTPEVKKALDSRHARHATIRQLKNQGLVGENNQGYVAVIANQNGSGSLAAAENSDRQVIYGAIADQNNLGTQGISLVEKAFADVHRERAHAGDNIQLPSGEWVRK